MKPDWKDAPEWAEWLVKDGDFKWQWFRSEPSFAAAYRENFVGAVGQFQSTLERRPCNSN